MLLAATTVMYSTHNIQLFTFNPWVSSLYKCHADHDLEQVYIEHLECIEHIERFEHFEYFEHIKHFE